MKFSNRLRQQRKIKGLTQKAVSEFVGVSKVAVSRWELGHSIPVGDSLNKLAELLECSSAWLLNGDAYSDVVMVSYYSEVQASAGNGSMADDEGTEKTPIPKKIIARQTCKDNLCCIKVTGRSMEPVLTNGSVIALNPCVKNIKDGLMYVIRQGDLLRVKILIETPDSIIVRSYNEQFDDEVYPKKDLANELEVIGQVFWYSSSIEA